MAEMMDFIRFNPWYLFDFEDNARRRRTKPTRCSCTLKGFSCAITLFNFPIAIGYNLPTVMICGNTVVRSRR
jgi:acyl-CoA reductase-like NAD-dependent aldehyde dehydrogenase